MHLGFHLATNGISEGGIDMPVITFDGGKLNKAQKAELAKIFTENAARVTNIPAAAFVVFFKENDLENVATGGVLLADRHQH